MAIVENDKENATINKAKETKWHRHHRPSKN
jgi:hypothetical protein